jgi:ComF family protein
MNIFRNLLNLLYPGICLSCDSRLEDPREYLCPECEKNLEFVTEFCGKCGSYTVLGSCSHCSENVFTFTAARSVFKYSKEIKALIHYLKYNEYSRIARYFSVKMAEYLKTSDFLDHIDYICPVPLHRVKKRERGYNQAELITKNLSSILKIRHIPNLIKRKRYTETQTLLSKTERADNVRNAFWINSKYNVKDKSILLIDDVFTTGATVNSISNLLKHKRVGKIYVLTIARA